MFSLVRPRDRWRCPPFATTASAVGHQPQVMGTDPMAGQLALPDIARRDIPEAEHPRAGPAVLFRGQKKRAPIGKGAMAVELSPLRRGQSAVTAPRLRSRSPARMCRGGGQRPRPRLGSDGPHRHGPGGQGDAKAGGPVCRKTVKRVTAVGSCAAADSRAADGRPAQTRHSPCHQQRGQKSPACRHDQSPS